VLIGLQMPLTEQDNFQCCLDELGFTYEEATQNLAYRLFSGGVK
jgi:threonine dehydratase